MTNSPINMAFSAPWSKKFRENKIQRKMAGQIIIWCNFTKCLDPI